MKNGIESAIVDRLDSLRTTIHEIGDKLGDVKDEVNDRGQALLKTVGRLVRQHPFAAIGIAAGVGVSIGVLSLVLMRDR